MFVRIKKSGSKLGFDRFIINKTISNQSLHYSQGKFKFSDYFSSCEADLNPRCTVGCKRNEAFSSRLNDD